jgi:hypothetical protein
MERRASTPSVSASVAQLRKSAAAVGADIKEERIERCKKLERVEEEHWEKTQ